MQTGLAFLEEFTTKTTDPISRTLFAAVLLYCLVRFQQHRVLPLLKLVFDGERLDWLYGSERTITADHLGRLIQFCRPCLNQYRSNIRIERARREQKNERRTYRLASILSNYMPIRQYAFCFYTSNATKIFQ
ncbi:hypothetical protein Tcan_00267 [Toxocara canis]|uniref:Uncharacterized protein n=1 Tax=Toxocara canis TaxID=6265 RepID=A0A0B2UWL7_TOXCA|nr:hypothetical protein Tcan_00267 [Toxocara canis]